MTIRKKRLTKRQKRSLPENTQPFSVMSVDLKRLDAIMRDIDWDLDSTDEKALMDKLISAGALKLTACKDRFEADALVRERVRADMANGEEVIASHRIDLTQVERPN